MIAAAPILMQIVLSASALLGLYALQNLLARRDPWDPVARRFLFGIRVTMLLFLGRILTVVTGAELFRILTLLGAALIPLAVILLTEALLRRHAPPAIKAVMALGTVIFTLSAFWYGQSIDPARLSALLAFQMLGFVLSGWLIIMRDKAALSGVENAMVLRLGLSLLLFIPLAAGDFLMLQIGLPVQFSALAVLILCWLAIGLGRSAQGVGQTIWQLVLMLGAGAGFGGLVGLLTGGGPDAVLMAMAAVIAALFVVAIITDSRALWQEDQALGLLRYLAQEQHTDPVRFLQGLQDHPQIADVTVIDPAALSGLQMDVLARIFAQCPVLRRSDPPSLGPVADDHLGWLFDRYGASHILLASQRPFVLVALSMPSLGQSPGAELELQIVQRMAALKGTAKHG
jgi:hypothetical protein